MRGDWKVHRKNGANWGQNRTATSFFTNKNTLNVGEWKKTKRGKKENRRDQNRHVQNGSKTLRRAKPVGGENDSSRKNPGKSGRCAT